MNNNWIKLSKYAKHFNISYRTAHRHFHNGNIPYETKTLPTGTILVNLVNLQNEIFSNRDAIIYCRVSSTYLGIFHCKNQYKQSYYVQSHIEGNTNC